MAYNFAAASSRNLSTASSPASGSPMTIAAWARPTATGDFVICSVGVSSASHRNQLQIGQGAVNLTINIFAAGASGTGQGTRGIVRGSSVWSHFAGVCDSSTLRKAFIDGVAGADNTTNCGSQNAANSIVVGARWNTTLGNYMTGDIAEVGVWDVALTQPEIASLAQGMTCDKVRPQSLVFYAPLVRDLQDVRGGLTITNNNTATVAVHPRVYS
jgi:hypothetical protein